MAAVRRSTRIATMNASHAVFNASMNSSPAAPTVSNEVPHAVLQEMNAVTADTFKMIRLLHDTVKERADPDDITAEALVWLKRLSWAVEDCHEFKTRQLTENYDEDVLLSVPPFLGLLRTLAAEINEAIAYFRMHPHLSRSLVLHATTIGSSIRASFYHI
jgi:hypothetical protein